MKLITEEAESVKVLTESVNGTKKLFIEGIFLQGDCVNRNKRLYEMKTLRNAVAVYTENFLNKNRGLGELNHPPTPGINLDRVSHKILWLKEKNTNFFGKAEILNTPMGKIAQNLYEAGVQLGVSSRALGSLRSTNEGYSVVGNDLILSTAADIVHDPSAPDAFVQGIYEGKEWVWSNGILEEKVESIQKKVESYVVSKELQEKKLDLFNEFLNSL